jgi:DNA-binding NtrC family response regulator
MSPKTPDAQVGREGRSARVLLADRDAAPEQIGRVLSDPPCELHVARDAVALRAALDAEPELVMLDVHGLEADGVELIEEIRARCPDSEVIVMTGDASIDSAVACMRAGAYDYLTKPLLDAARLRAAVARALERRRLRLQARPPRAAADPAADARGACPRLALAQIVCNSPAMARVVRLIRDLSHNHSNVLIEAPSGAGKELVARAIHETSERAAGPFVPVDCGALPEGIVEGELFGYERGAFTGAHRAVPGLFRSAHGGTLFLDEIGELPLALQAKLLRAIQQREVRPLGTAEPIAVDVRIVAATNRDLAAEVQAGRFRADLFYRLRVVSISIPPLRERREDIPALVGRFLARRAHDARVRGIEPEALEALLHHSWEGNVRELENTLEAAIALAPGPQLTLRDLRLGGGGAWRAPAPRDIPLALDAYEAACLGEVLRRAGGDVARAARILGIGRSTLYRKMARHGLASPPKAGAQRGEAASPPKAGAQRGEAASPPKAGAQRGEAERR